MYGILFFTFCGIVLAVGSIKEGIENGENRIKFRHKNGLTYIDNKGRDRLLSNNHIAMYHVDYTNGRQDYVLEDIESHVIIKNFTKEKQDREYEESREKAVGEGKSTFCIDSNNYKKYIISEKGFEGKRFKDLQTGKIYVIRKIKFRYYYMNIENGFIVRETDYSKEHIPVDEISIPIDITEFNKKQANKMETYNWASDSMSEFHS